MQKFPVYFLLPPHMRSLPLSTSSTTDNISPLSTSPTWMGHLSQWMVPSDTSVSTRVCNLHCWYHTFCGFKEMYHDMSLPLHHTEYFHCHKNPPCFRSVHSSHPPCLVTTNFFTISIISLLFQNVIYLGYHTVCSHLDWLCSMDSRFLHTFIAG